MRETRLDSVIALRSGGLPAPLAAWVVARVAELIATRPRIVSAAEVRVREDGEVRLVRDLSAPPFSSRAPEVVMGADGDLRACDAGATMTPAATSGTSVIFTASAAVFTDTATDAGKEIWKKAIVGIGDGRATILTVTDSTHAVCNITRTFDSTNAMAAGNWYLTAITLGGFAQLEGEVLTLIVDGAEHPQKTVVSGLVTLDFQASKAHGGLGYLGRLITLNLESGGLTGPAQTKPRNIADINVRFFNTLRARFGTDLYNLEEMGFRNTTSLTNRPQPLFTGIKNVTFDDEWQREKQVIIEQVHPLPCVVQALDIFMETADE